jgi:hypothetical protein
MFETYDAMVKERIHLRSPLSSKYLQPCLIPDQTFLKVMIRAELLQNIENSANLRFFACHFLKKECSYEGKNKKEEHHHVARWMHASQGQELKLNDGSAFSKKGQVVELSFDIPLDADT